MTGASRLSGLMLLLATAIPAAAQSRPIVQERSCSSEATEIRRAETELPRLEVAPPQDQQMVCITLETNVLFARRLAAHLKHCPRSPLVRQGGAWRQTERDYMAQFSDRRCKPAIRGFRG